MFPDPDNFSEDTMNKAQEYSKYCMLVWGISLMSPAVGFSLGLGHFVLLLAPSTAQLLYFKEISWAARWISFGTAASAFYGIFWLLGVAPF